METTANILTPQPTYAVTLRQWCLCKDEEAFRQLVRRGDHTLTDGHLPEFYTEGCEYRWIQGMVDSLLFGDGLHYAVEVEDQVVGCVNVSRCGGVYRRMGVLRLILLPEWCGKGIGTQVVAQIVAELFRYDEEGGYVYKAGFERLHARVVGQNKAAERVLEKNGFLPEGILHNAVCKNGRIYDQKIFGYVDIRIR